VLALAVTVAAATGCAAGPSPGAAAARDWADGPARWLLLPDERDALRRVRTAPELTRFLQDFWRRRDDDPATPEVPLGALFAERVAAADRLYPEDGVRGALSDRGGVLVLLGPPTMLSYSTHQAPSWEGRRAPGVRPTRPVRIEIWTYLPADLRPEVRARLQAAGELESGMVRLTFLMGPQHTRLIEGRALLVHAACAWASCDSDG
jgi:GWxTD domain-containing protein